MIMLAVLFLIAGLYGLCAGYYFGAALAFVICLFSILASRINVLASRVSYPGGDDSLGIW